MLVPVILLAQAAAPSPVPPGMIIVTIPVTGEDVLVPAPPPPAAPVETAAIRSKRGQDPSNSVTIPVQSEVPVPAAPALPNEVRTVIEAAIKSGDAAAVDTVAKFARAAYPSASGDIDAVVKDFRTARAEAEAKAKQARLEKVAEAGPLDLWKGQAELGGARSTGTTSSLGVYAALNANREGIKWRHRIEARAELQRTNGVLSKERITASWQPRYATSGRLYVYGLSQYEHDPFLGFDSRYTLGAGGGYSVIAKPGMRLDLEGGPAFRQTDYHADTEGDASMIAARASANFSWKISPRLEFRQTGSLYFEEDNGSGNAVSALDATLFGPLKVRLSYELRYERDTMRNVDTLDTSSRATFVLGF
jgi:putative salt-induced outer membrane protein